MHHYLLDTKYLVALVDEEPSRAIQNLDTLHWQVKENTACTDPLCHSLCSIELGRIVSSNAAHPH